MSSSKEFRLQPILNLKSTLLEMLEVEFAYLKLAHQREVETLLRLQHSQAQVTELLRQQQQTILLDCETIQQLQHYLHILAERITQQGASVRASEVRMESKREELVKAMQDQKTLEKLREQHLAKQRQHLLHQEANMIDDIVTTRYRRER